MLKLLNNPYHLAYINIIIVIIVTIILFVYKYIFPKKNINFVILIIIISLVASWSVFRSGTYQSGDLRTHTVQLVSFYQNLQEGIFLPRWAGELCGGYGCPVLEFFYILPYYIASLFHLIGFSYLTSLKLLLAGSFMASGITMYYWAKDEFGSKAGLVGSIFYLFAPYHLIDFHFRAGIGEVLSFVFIPLLFLFSKKLIQTRKIKYFLLELLTVSLLLMSHSSTSTVVIPLAIIYGFIVWFRQKKRDMRELLLFFISLIFGILIITFYWLPALMEVKYTWYGFWVVGDFRPILEYIYSPARFGLLFQGNQGEYRLIIGYFHLLAIISAIFLFIMGKIGDKAKPFIIFFIISFFVLFFMMLESSKSIWQSIHFLNTFLMVWRLLIPIAFITSAIAAIVATKLKNNLLLGLICFLVITSTILNWGNRKMVSPPINPFFNEVENYTEYVEPGNPIDLQRYISHARVKSSIVTSSIAFKKPIVFIKGGGKYTQLQRSQVFHEYVLQADTSSLIQENTYYFPGWTVYVDNKQTQINYKNEFGVITFPLEKGVHKIDVIMKDTPVIVISKYISIFSFILLLIFILRINNLTIRAKKRKP